MIGSLRGAAAACLFAAAPGSATPLAAQLVARATYLDEGSFQLSSVMGQAPLEPVALATDSRGRIHVVDRRGAVFVYTANGSLETSYGADELRRPIAIELDRDDSAYVLDDDSKLVQVFREDERRYSIGAGKGPARLRNPVDLAVGPGGFVFVLDRSGPTVQVFGRDGVYVRAISLQQQIDDPVSLTVDGDGTLLIASRRTPGQIHVLQPFFEHPWTGLVPPTGLDVGATGQPTSVVTDGLGTAVLLDAAEGRIWGGQRVRPDIDLLRRPIYGGRGTGRGSFRSAVDIAFTNERDLLILDSDLRKIERIALTQEERTEPLTYDFPVRVGQMPPDLDGGAMMTVRGAEEASAWMALSTDRGRSLVLTTAAGQRWTDLYGHGFRAFAPEAGETGEMFRQILRDAPGDVAFNDTLLVIAETRPNRFSVFDLRTGASLGSYGDNYGDDRRLRDPTGIDLMSDGRVVVADHGNDRVAVFSSDLASLIGAFTVIDVEGVAVAPGDRIFAWNRAGNVVVELPADGSATRPLEGSLVPGPVRDLTFDRAGNLFALEAGTSRVTVVSSALDRTFVRFGGRDPDFDGDFISVDAAGNVYVASTDQAHTYVYRWDLALPALTALHATLTRDGASLTWDRIESPFLDGYQVQGAPASTGPFAAMALTSSNGATVDVEESADVRWLRVAPVTIAGATTAASEPVRLAHLELRAVHEAGDNPALVIGYMNHLDSLVEAGGVAVDDNVVQELNWRALDAEVEHGFFEDAVAREGAVRGWTGDDGGYGVHVRLAEAHATLGNHEKVLEHARAALDVLPEPMAASDEELELLELAFASAAEVGDHQVVASLGEVLLDRIPADREYGLLARIAGARLEMGQPAVALAMAEEVGRREMDAELIPSGDDRGRLALAALRAAIRLDNPEAVERWKALASASMTGSMLNRYHTAIGAYELRRGNLEAVRSSLTHLSVLADAQILADPATIELSLAAYRALQDADTQGRSAGLTFLAEYHQAIPDEAEDLKRMYADTLAVFEVREDTHGKLGPGFEAWRSANFGALVPFFEGLLAGDTVLTRDQELLARALLAGGYVVVGRADDARGELLGILALAPDHDPEEANSEWHAAYAVTPFDATLTRLLNQMRGGSQ